MTGAPLPIRDESGSRNTLGPMSVPIVVAVVAAAYAIGTFPTALLVGRRFGFDPTASGSGNPGTSNTMRVGGKKAGILVLVGDLGKGVIAAGAGLWIDGRTLGWIAGAASVAGHMWPVTRKFKGGKGVATAAGVGVVCFPIAMVAVLVVFVLVLKVTRRAAVGSIVAVCLMPPLLAVAGRPGVEVAISVGVAAAVVLRHRSNIVEIRDEGAIRRASDDG